MKNGYKYFIAEDMDGFGVIEKDLEANIDEFIKDYDKIDFKTPAGFYNVFSSEWIAGLHQIYHNYVEKNVLTVGIGSGLGEQELFLSEKGYNMIASDVVEDLCNKTASVFPEFRALTLDIFKDDILRSIEKKFNISDPKFDVLLCGMDFYFDDIGALELFRRLADNMQSGSHLIFTLRYRDYPLAGVVEYYQYLEAFIVSFLKRKKVIYKHHGYRRTAGEIMKMAGSSGFVCEKKHLAMYGCEWYRSKLGAKILRHIFKFTDKYIYPFFYSAVVFKFRKL